MLFSEEDVASFWSGSWSRPFRSACRWLSPELKTHVSPDPRPGQWLSPRCVQRWVSQAVADRLAWMQAHPEALYRYAGPADNDPSRPCWTEGATFPHFQWSLREASEERLLLLWGIDVERLLRISEAPPFLLSGDSWAQAALGVYERLSQVYAELKRRHGFRQARAMLREELRRFVVWKAVPIPQARRDTVLLLSQRARGECASEDQRAQGML